MDYDSGVVRHFRTDSGQLANERKMTHAERQMRLDEIEVNPVDEAEQLAQEQVDAEHEAHIANVQRTMAQEQAVAM